LFPGKILKACCNWYYATSSSDDVKTCAHRGNSGWSFLESLWWIERDRMCRGINVKYIMRS